MTASFRSVCIFVICLSATAPLSGQEKTLVYPATRTVEQTDDFHGTSVADPYRWLEDDVRTSTDVAAWVKAQNQLTFGYLGAIPQRQSIVNRMTELWNYEKISAPFRRGGRYYFSRNDGLQNQNVLWMQESLDSQPSVLLDPNAWSKDGTTALSGTAFSDDGRWVAYAVQEAGSDWNTWKIMEIETRRVLEDDIRWVKFSGAEWTPDSRGFFYAHYPEPEAGAGFSVPEQQHESLLPQSWHPAVRRRAGL